MWKVIVALMLFVASPAMAGDMCCDGGFIRGEDKQP